MEFYLPTSSARMTIILGLLPLRHCWKRMENTSPRRGHVMSDVVRRSPGWSWPRSALRNGLQTTDTKTIQRETSSSWTVLEHFPLLKHFRLCICVCVLTQTYIKTFSLLFIYTIFTSKYINYDAMLYPKFKENTHKFCKIYNLVTFIVRSNTLWKENLYRTLNYIINFLLIWLCCVN